MKINEKRSSRKKVIISTIIIVVILVAGALVFAHANHSWPFQKASQPDSVNYNPPTKAQSNAAGSVKSKNSESSGTDRSPSPIPSTNPGQKPTVGMTITAANETSGTLYIRTLIQTISSSGMCSLSMTGPNNTNYTTNSGVQANPSASTCQGFDVPVSSLTPGAWHVTISYSDSNVTASASKDISVQ